MGDDEGGKRGYHMSDAGISLHLPDIAASLKGRARGLLTPAETIRTAVMIPLLEAEDGVSVLFTKRARTLRRQPGKSRSRAAIRSRRTWTMRPPRCAKRARNWAFGRTI
ncbi:hypothetical protein GCM10025857_24440 [Alicyclobacillus contaminans]|nr:hypothetical protein GCM10025857_24440 [Alicyclobacillus contaminans]